MFAAADACDGGNEAACIRKEKIITDNRALMEQRSSDYYEACRQNAGSQGCINLQQEVDQAPYQNGGYYDSYLDMREPGTVHMTVLGTNSPIEADDRPRELPNSQPSNNGGYAVIIDSSYAINSSVFGDNGGYGSNSDTPYIESRYAGYFGTTYNQNNSTAWNIELGPTGVLVFDTALDFTPLGTFNDFVTAETWGDYVWLGLGLGLAPLKLVDKLGDAAKAVKRAGGKAGPATDKAGNQIGRFIVDSKGNTMIEPLGGRTVSAGKGGVDTHTLYPNGSNYQRLNPQGHANNPTPHGHGHAPGTGPGMRGQGSSLDVNGNVVPFNSPAAHWPIR